MKRVILKRYAVLLFSIIFLHISAIAGKASERRRSIDKSYQVSGNTELSIKNRFGKVHVNTWDKNQVDVHIEIVVRSDKDSRLQELLDAIEINIEDSSPENSLSFRTSVNGNNFGHNTSFEINYTVSMPVSNSLDLANSFGDVYVGDLKGSVTLDVQYGNLNGGRFSGSSDVKLAFGSGFSEIELLSRGDLRISYSKLNVEEMGDLDINSQFSTLEVGKAGKLDLVGKYGEINIGEIDNLDANVNFSGFEINRLNSIMDLDIDYGGSNNIGLSSTVTRVDIKNSFGPLNLEIAPGTNADIQANLSFCDLKYNEGQINFNKIIKDHTSSEYVGKIGKGGNTNLVITSKYGSVRIK